MAQRSIGQGPAYSLPVNILQTGTTAVDTAVWSMRNAAASGKNVFIEKLRLAVSFHGTAAGSTNSYYLCRFDTATPSSGSALTVVKMDSVSPTSAVTDARFVDTGLTVTSVAFGAALHYLNNPISVTSGRRWDEIDLYFQPFVLAPGEGLAIRLGATAVVGQGISGSIQWRERSST